MDRIDKKILCALDANCRIPYSLMAKKLRIARNVLDYRIKKMERDGIITNYICSINLGKLGYKTYKIYYKMRAVSAEQEAGFIGTIDSEKNVIHFLKTEGSFDFAVVIAVKSIRELDLFLSEITATFNDIINEYVVSIVVWSRIFKLEKLLLGTKQELVKFDKYSEDSPVLSLDDEDKAILKALSQQANSSVVALAKETGLTIDIVRYRLKELSKQAVNSFRVIIDLHKLGFFHYVCMVKIRNASVKEEQAFIQWCTIKQNIVYITKRIGMFDYEINVVITDIHDLHHFLAELKQKFGNIIDTYELMINSKKLKLNYLPW